MSRPRLGLLALLAALSGAPRLPAQQPEGFLGFEGRSLSFRKLPGLDRLRQISIPFGATIPLGRLTLDFGSAYASTSLRRPDSTRHEVGHLTDSQLRAAYVFGQDAVVATVLVNLPTGPGSASVRDYTVVGAVSPAFLGYPVAAYASGFSVTSGVAAAVGAGAWSLGLAGSLRLSSRFTPYVDSAGPITYKPGLEGRVRAGADGLVGSSRLSLGFTYSTFGDDQFGRATIGRGQYRPGPRWLAEAAVVAPIGAGLLTLSAWNYHRTAGDTTGGSAANRENLAVVELSSTIPIGAWLAIEPVASTRFSKPEVGRGWMGGLGTGLRLRVSDAVTVSPVFRYDTGWIEDPQGARAHLSGGYLSAFIRAQF